MNWSAYYRYWDDFVRNWLENETRPWDDISQAFFDMGAFDFNEMPDPYFGTPDRGVEAVFLNINPGGSQTGTGAQNLEASKYYSLRGNGAWQLDAFVQKYGATYSKYIEEFSCLSDKAKNSIGPGREICGASWWLGTDRREGRLAWLNRFYRNFYKRDIDPNKVFAPEFCPFHSRKASFGVDTLLNAGVPATWFKDHVITPAAEAARAAGIPVVGVGKVIYKALESLGYKRQDELDWNSGLENWPKNKKGMPSERHFYFYEVEGVKFLVTWAQGGNNPPGREFANIERFYIWPKLKSEAIMRDTSRSITKTQQGCVFPQERRAVRNIDTCEGVEQKTKMRKEQPPQDKLIEISEAFKVNGFRPFPESSRIKVNDGGFWNSHGSDHQFHLSMIYNPATGRLVDLLHLKAWKKLARLSLYGSKDAWLEILNANRSKLTDDEWTVEIVKPEGDSGIVLNVTLNGIIGFEGVYANKEYVAKAARRLFDKLVAMNHFDQAEPLPDDTRPFPCGHLRKESH